MKTIFLLLVFLITAIGQISAQRLSQIKDVTATASEVNKLHGIPSTLTATEIGYVDGVVSAIQDQLL